MASTSTKEAERKPKGEGSVFQRADNGKWYFRVRFMLNGESRELRQEIPGDHEDADAAWKASKDIRHECLAKVARNEVQPSRIENVTCDELLDDYIVYLKRDKPRSAYIIEKSIEANIRPYFGEIKAARLETAHSRTYRARRKVDGVSDTTVNRELSYMRSALYRAKNHCTPGKVRDIPYFDMASEQGNVRKGFLELEHYGDVLRALPISLKCLFVCAYHIGNRKGAMLALKWNQVDFNNSVLYLEDNQKVEPVTAPIYGDMRTWFERQKKFRDDNFPEQDHVFFWYPLDCEIDPDLKAGHGGCRTEPGSRIDSFRATWIKAVKDVGHPGLLFHDLRRSAVRNLIRLAGLSEKEAMEISGHKTDAMIRRYNIRGNQDAQRLGKRLDEFWKAQTVAAKPKLR